MLNPVSGDNPTENLKECDFVDDVINDSKFGFTCDNVDGQLGFINLPHIPKSQDYAAFDNREIKILQADRYNDYLESFETSLHGIFQDSTCGSNTNYRGCLKHPSMSSNSIQAMIAAFLAGPIHYELPFLPCL